MSDNQLTHVVQPALDQAVTAACHGLAPNSKRAYARHLREFIAWWSPQGCPFDRLAASQFMDRLGPDCSPARYNQTLAAIKRLANEAAGNGWLAHQRAAEIASLRSRPARGVRAGIWLSKAQTAELLTAPGSTTLSGLRDSVALSLLIGCGLRRAEACAVTFDQLQTLEGRMHIMNLKGKGGRVRTLRVPDWTAEVICRWRKQSGLNDGPVLRSFMWDGSINGSLSPSAVHDIVTHYTELMGARAAPHDMRRTFAKLARKGGAPLEVLQRTLGHASLTTTEKYVNSGEEANAGDYLQL